MEYPEEMKDKARDLHGRGHSIREVERELAGPSRMTVWRWIAGAHDGPGARVKPTKRRREMELPKVEGEGPIYPDVDPEDKDEIIRRPRLENDILRGTQEALKGRALGCSTNREKSKLIEWLGANADHPLKELTASLRISKSSHEYWRRKLANPGPTLREEMAGDVERVFREDGDSARGYRFVHARLVEERGTVTEKAVRDVMRERGLVVVYRKKARRYSSYAGELDEAPPNLPLNEDGTHDFHAGAPSEKWVTDITEFKLPDDPRKVYLSPVVDLFDSKPVSWSIGLRPDADLANSSLEAACATLKC